jgi:hypothetical protein
MRRPKVRAEQLFSGPSSEGSGGGLGLRRGLLGGDLDAVGELHTLDHLWQLIVAVEAAPAFLCGLDEFEDHGERGLVREAAFRPDRAVPHALSSEVTDRRSCD